MAKIIPNADVSHIPDGWIFTHFAARHGTKITQPFDGSTIRARSFWSEDKTPSLFFFAKNKKYWFKCFASDHGGDSLHFVKILEGAETYAQASILIMSEWSEFLGANHIYRIEVKEHKYVEGKPKGEYIVVPGDWTRKHINFWREYKISDETLFKYNVVPIQNYKYISSKGQANNFQPEIAFAFMCKKGPYQLYLPENDPKYITILPDYYPGWEQLGDKNKHLAIISGLKDIMAFDSYNFSVDCIAGKSESNLIDEQTVVSLIKKYDFLFSIGDYDPVGLRMMSLYHQIYAIKQIVIKIEKDIAENNRRHDLNFMKDKYAMAINKQLNQENVSPTLPV